MTREPDQVRRRQRRDLNDRFDAIVFEANACHGWISQLRIRAEGTAEQLKRANADDGLEELMAAIEGLRNAEEALGIFRRMVAKREGRQDVDET